MDLRMPIMDGITATKICKEKEHLKHLPIIIVTAELGDEVREAAINAHASYFLNKPAKSHEIHDVLKRFLNL
jgi:CheY-like chemotaxis protein